MTQFERLDRRLQTQDGLLRTADAAAEGVSRPHFYEYVKARGLERTAHGVYLSKETWADPMYLLHLRCEQAVFSHETALFLHDLTDQEPLRYRVTVRSGYNPSKLAADGVKVYTIKKELHLMGAVTMSTPFGREVKAYDLERTVCDMVRSRGSVEQQAFQTTIRRYAGRRDKNLRRLMGYAKELRVEKKLRQYLEVLL